MHICRRDLWNFSSHLLPNGHACRNRYCNEQHTDETIPASVACSLSGVRKLRPISAERQRLFFMPEFVDLTF
jgi:hypothetical protein